MDAMVKLMNKPGSSALYIGVATKLIDEIESGRYPVGTLLPTEVDLAKSYGVSRQTLRAALDLLHERGYISRKKSVGTRVEALEPAPRYVQTVDTIDDLVKIATWEVRDISTVEEITLGKAHARRLQAPMESAWLVLSGRRVDVRAQREPVAVVKFYIDVRYRRICQQILDEPDKLISSIIERDCGEIITELVQIVTALALGADAAEMLGRPSGSAGLQIIRHYKNSRNEILIMSETLYAEGRLNLLTRLRRT